MTSHPPAPESTDAAPFGKYKLFASLGRGGMADVFLAVSRGPLGFNKLVVVKRLRTGLAEDPSFLGMFLDEARLAARLNHPNVVHTYEVGEAEGSYFIAMEYLEGQPLNRVIKDLAKHDQELDEGICARIVADALSGLHHAHTLKDYDGKPLEIVHRDVSPHNVFVTYDGQVKLVDFGIAKAASSSTVTEVGVLKGKVAYMAPEQAMGGAIDCRADLFGMGIVLWELLARRRLLAGDTAAATLHRLLNEPIPPISTVRDVDLGLAAILARALEKEASRRYQTAQEMREALEEWIRASGRKLRQEEIGAQLTAMYGDVRDDVKRQVQEQMALLTAGSADSASPAPLGVGAARGAATGRPPRLPEIGVGSGSGSGVVKLGGVAPPSDEPEPRRRGVLALFLLLLVLALACVLYLVVRVAVAPKDDVVAERFSATALPSASGPPAAAVASLIPSATAPSSVGPTATAPSSVGPTATASIAPTATAPPTASTPPTQSPTKPPPATTRPSSPSVGSPDETGPGYLTFDTYPWTRVTEGGRLLGTTPLIKIPMSPGAHTLVLENPEQGIKKTYVVNIKGGETFSMRLGLSK